MAIQTVDFQEWLKANPSVVSNAIKSNFLSIAQNDIVNAMNQNLRPLQDGVYIGKYNHQSWGYYINIEPWQTTQIGIKAADADAIVIQMGGYRIGIALDETTLPWGSSTTVQVNKSNDLNSYNGKALTAAIMANAAYKNDDPTKYAVAYAYNYKKSHAGDPGGDSEIGAHQWWLPTMGDLALIHQHFETINLAIARINAAGKQKATPLARTYYWSCCEPSADYAWRLAFSGGGRGSNGKGDSGRVRPVTAF